MSFAWNQTYTCCTCKKRLKTDERRPVKGNQNKLLRKFLSKTFMTNVCDNDVVCNKCRQLYYSSLKLRHPLINIQGNENFVPSCDKITLEIPSSGYRHDCCLSVIRKRGNLLYFLTRHDSNFLCTLASF